MYAHFILSPLTSLTCAHHRLPQNPNHQNSSQTRHYPPSPGVMESRTLAIANLRSSTTYSTKFLTDHTHIQTQELPKFFVQLSKRSSKPASYGLQKNPRKDLSRILRTDAAVKGIVRKANSRKYKQLWPKAVLEALDDAIRENQWENALKVSGFLFLF